MEILRGSEAQFELQRKLMTTTTGDLFVAHVVEPIEHGPGGVPHFPWTFVPSEVVLIKRYIRPGAALQPAPWGGALEGNALQMSTTSPDSLEGHEREQELEHELGIVARLQGGGRHANLIHYRETISFPGGVYLVMEYCPSGDLFSLVSTNAYGRLPEREALRCTLHVVRGLLALHEHHGLAHGNVSLENVVLDDQGVYKLVDFRFTRALTDADPNADNADGNRDNNMGGQERTTRPRWFGDVDYMTPEAAKYPKRPPVVGVAADLWALGVVLFTLLTGSPLVQISTGPDRDLTFSALGAVGCSELLRVWGLDHFVSPIAKDLLNRMLAVPPSARPQSAAEVIMHPALASTELNRDAQQEAQ